ncbi:MAG: HAD family hydrolase, partial [Paracoccaceae bacterium]
VCQQLGRSPLVIDSQDIRADPGAALVGLCAALGVPYTPAMLQWSAGPKPYDGVWAPHWYNAVHASTGFEAPEGALPDLSAKDQALADQAMPHFLRLSAFSLGGSRQERADSV